MMTTFTKAVLSLFNVILSLSVFSKETKFINSPPATEPKPDKFYKKYTDAIGVPIVSSWRVLGEAIIKVAQKTELFPN